MKKATSIGAPPQGEPLGHFLELVPDPTVIVSGEGVILLANRHAERAFGYEAGELLGRTVESLLPHAARGRHAELLRDDFASPRPRAMGMHAVFHGRRRDGTLFPVEDCSAPSRAKARRWSARPSATSPRAARPRRGTPSCAARSPR